MSKKTAVEELDLFHQELNKLVSEGNVRNILYGLKGLFDSSSPDELWSDAILSGMEDPKTVQALISHVEFIPTGGLYTALGQLNKGGLILGTLGKFMGDTERGAAHKEGCALLVKAAADKVPEIYALAVERAENYEKINVSAVMEAYNLPAVGLEVGI